MINAPVGFQCPECVANAQVTLPKTRFGGSFNTVPKVTRAILITCISIFVLSLLLGSFALAFGMIPAAIAQGEWWRLLTSTLLHGSILHLLFNMYALYWLGPQLERFARARAICCVVYLVGTWRIRSVLLVLGFANCFCGREWGNLRIDHSDHCDRS